MNCLVSSDVKDQILHSPLSLWHVPVRYSELRDLKLWVGPLWQVSVLNLANAARVGMDCLLLEVTDKTVGNLGRDQVAEEHGVEEDSLRANDHLLHEPPRLAHLHEGEKVHAFVV